MRVFYRTRTGVNPAPRGERKGSFARTSDSIWTIGGPVVVIEKACDAVLRLLSVTSMVKLVVAETPEGVPVICPVEVFRLAHAGSALR